MFLIQTHQSDSDDCITVGRGWDSQHQSGNSSIHSHLGVWHPSLGTLAVFRLSAPRWVHMHQSESSHIITDIVTDFWSI